MINYPQQGDTVQGVVEISGTVVSDSFSYAEIYYAYSIASTENWFLIGRIEEGIENGVLARWDTTTITDGEYQVKLKLIKSDQSFEEIIIAPVYVRNYSIEPTITPAPTGDLLISGEISPTISMDLIYSTPLPGNPASISVNGIKKSITAGIIVSLVVLAGLWIYKIFSNNQRLK